MGFKEIQILLEFDHELCSKDYSLERSGGICSYTVVEVEFIGGEMTPIDLYPLQSIS